MVNTNLLSTLQFVMVAPEDCQFSVRKSIKYLRVIMKINWHLQLEPNKWRIWRNFQLFANRLETRHLSSNPHIYIVLCSVSHINDVVVLLVIVKVDCLGLIPIQFCLCLLMSSISSYFLIFRKNNVGLHNTQPEIRILANRRKLIFQRLKPFEKVIPFFK